MIREQENPFSDVQESPLQDERSPFPDEQDPITENDEARG